MFYIRYKICRLEKVLIITSMKLKPCLNIADEIISRNEKCQQILYFKI
jgi:hypothetical protein